MEPAFAVKDRPCDDNDQIVTILPQGQIPLLPEDSAEDSASSSGSYEYSEDTFEIDEEERGQAGLIELGIDFKSLPSATLRALQSEVAKTLPATQYIEKFHRRIDSYGLVNHDLTDRIKSFFNHGFYKLPISAASQGGSIYDIYSYCSKLVLPSLFSFV